MAQKKDNPPPRDDSGAGAVDVSPATKSEGKPPALELLADTPDAAPKLAEVEAALSDDPPEPATGASPSGAPTGAPESASASPGRSGVTGEASAGATGERPSFKKWSGSKHKNATRKDMSGRIRELEALAETLPPASGAPAGEAGDALPPDAVEKLTADMLARTFAIVSGIGARVRGEHWRLKESEQELLSAVWAPVLAPHLGGMAKYLPLAAAVAVTADIAWPRIEADMSLSKSAGAEALPVVMRDTPTE